MPPSTHSSFKLSFGQIRPFPRGGDERVMLVSDLDGTMFGDVSHPEAFNSSQRFLEYWESSQVQGGGGGAGHRVAPRRHISNKMDASNTAGLVHFPSHPLCIPPPCRPWPTACWCTTPDVVWASLWT